jgi:hypothetical protein
MHRDYFSALQQLRSEEEVAQAPHGQQPNGHAVGSMQHGPGQQPFGHADAVCDVSLDCIVNAYAAPATIKHRTIVARTTANLKRISMSPKEIEFGILRTTGDGRLSAKPNALEDM